MKRTGFLPIVMAVALVLTLTPTAVATTKYKYKILHAFTGGNDGGLVAATPMLDAGGNVYGTTYWGGAGYGQDCSYESGCGVIFELSPQENGRWKENVLFDFEDDTGNAGSVLFDASGNLFGSTSSLDYKAYIFELTPGGGGWSFDPIYGPSGGCLVFDQAGNLYGCIPPGDIGELSPGSGGWTYTDLWDDPCNGTCPDGATLLAPLSWDSDGNLYGTTLYGGNYPPECGGSAGCGVAFRMTPNGDGTWTYHVLHRFAATKTDGYYPYAGLTVDASGAAYGVTSAGGKYGTGTFFKLTPTKSGLWKETILYQFPNCANGCGPASTLVPDEAGNLYGSGAGGLHCGYDCGTVFKFTKQTNGTWKYNVVHKFNGKDGAFPFGVILDDKGNIFGTTFQGGAAGSGVAFEITQ